MPGHAGHHLLQLRQQGLGHGRVRGHGNVQPARGDVARAQHLFGRLDGGQRAGQHAQAFAIDGTQVTAPIQQGLQLGLGQGHRGHGALRQRLQQAAARRDDAQGMRQLEHASQAGRHILAQAVAQHGHGLHAACHPHPGQRVADHEQGRLGLVHGGQRRVGLHLFTRGGEQPLAQVPACFGLQQLAAAVHLLPEYTAVAVQVQAHVGVLHAPARRGLSFPGRLCRHLGGLACRRSSSSEVQALHRHAHAVGHHGTAMAEGAAALLQGVGHIVQ